MVWACVRKGFQVRVEAGGCILPPTIRIRLVMPHSPEEKKKVLTRIRRIRGQCEGLERALEAGADCGPVLQQIAALRGAVHGLMSAVLGSPLPAQFEQPARDAAARGARGVERTPLIAALPQLPL